MSQRLHPIDQLVGQRVRLIRLSRGLTQTGLASELGLTFQQVQKYEKGANRISASKLYQISKILGVEVADLFEDVVASDDVAATKMPGIDGIPTQKDLKILSEIARLPNGPVKGRVLSLISALMTTPGPAPRERKRR